MINVKPYFRAILKSLNYKEWKDGFDSENIPSSRYDRAFFVEANLFDGVAMNQTDCLDITAPVQVKVFLKGKGNIYDRIDDATAKGQAIVLECLKGSNRLSNPLKNVVFNSMEIEPLSDSNNDRLVININFTALDVLGVD